MTIGAAPVCLKCKHFNTDDNVTGLICTAFPDGIPDKILYGSSDHSVSYPGDNGIQFESNE